MLNFQLLQLEDLPRLRPYFKYSGSRICDTTPGAVALWRDLYRTEWAIYDGSLYFKVYYPGKGDTFALPLGGGRPEHYRQIAEYCRRRDMPLHFYPIPKDELDRMLQFFPGSTAEPDRDSFDYLYRAEDLMYFKGKEEYKVNASSAMSFKEMFRELKNNRMIQIVLVTYLLGFGRNIGLSIAVQASCIMIRDGIDLTKLGLGVMSGDACSWAIGLTSAISSMVTIILNPVINKKLGEKKYFIIAGFYGFAVSLISFLLYVLTPAETATGGVPFLRSIWAIWIYQFFLGFAYGPNGYLPMVMTADIVDYQEWKTGKRTEGTQFAILSMSKKLSNALSVSLGLLFIGAIGYSANSYADAVKVGVEIIDKKEVIVDAVAHTNAIHAAVPGSMQNKAWAIYFLLPGLCMLASSLVMFFYKIDEKTKKQMREELALRRGEATEETVAENAVDALSEASKDFEVSEENDKTEE